ncbi:MAG: GFA family protein [Pseudomonadota bacterium]
MTGGCLCGKVRYTTTSELRPVIGCHCVQCRKTSGHYVAATSARRDALQITGKVTWYQSSETARRGFCATCGSSLFWDGEGENISIHAGTLDIPTGLALSAHIFVADKGDYYSLDEDLPQAAGDDPALTTKVI